MHGAWALGCTIDGEHLDGHSRTFQVMDSRWLRCEVELRSANKRPIGRDVLIEPAAYYAGAYEAAHKLCRHPVQKIVPTGQQIAQASAQRAMDWLERTVAPVLVQINRSMFGDSDWLQGIVQKHKERPVPRSLRGLSPSAMCEGLRQCLHPFTDCPQPARAAA